MTWDDALAPVTPVPARSFGVADRYGSLEVGNVANVVVWSGDQFELLRLSSACSFGGRISSW